MGRSGGKAPRRRRYETTVPELDQKIEELVARAEGEFGEAAGAEYVRQLIVSALRLLRDGTDVGDLRLLNSSIKELRHSFRVFSRYKEVRKVAVFGSARTTRDHPDWQQAFAYAERMAREGWMTITGAGPGIMVAANGGAGREASFGVNIRLPYEQKANEVIADDSKLINFRYFFTRKVVFVKEAHALALFPGGFGTHDEGFEALTLVQTGKSQLLPVVFVDSPGGSYWKDWDHYVRTHLHARGLISESDLALYRVTDDLETAVQEVLDFYSNYHSSRYVDELLVLRVHRAPEPAQLEALNDEFADLLEGGRIEVGPALAREKNDVPGFPRVTLRYNRRDAGRLRMLIDRLNALVPDHASPREASPREVVEVSIPPEAAEEEAD